MTSDFDSHKILTELDVEECIHAVGLELLLMTEDLLYATRTLDETGCAALGDRIYLLTQVLGAVLMQHKRALSKFRVVLPTTIGSVRVRNPYYEGSREGSKPEGSEPTTNVGGDKSSIDEFPF